MTISAPSGGDQDLAGRVALVTGGAGGIGVAVVDRLLEAGVLVAATSRRTHRSSLRSHARLRWIEAELTEPTTLRDLVGDVEREYGSLDLLLPNAGVADVRTLTDTSLQDWQHSLDVNLTAPFALAQAAAPGMQQRGYGRILFTSSAAAFVGGFVGPHYAAAKAGLHGLTHFLSARLAADGITVNAVAPALIENTNMISGLSGDPSIPVGRLGRPHEVADLMLAVLRNGYLTGQVMLLDGGLHPI